jgi:CRISPR-associated Csx11 family protein
MTTKTLRECISENRPFILYCELLGLLHDIGKLSKGFCEFRQHWVDEKGGYYADPHDKDFFGKSNGDNGLLNNFTKLKEVFTTPQSPIVKTHYTSATDVSIKKAVDTHVEPQDELMQILKAADSVDSAIDRNNPLFWSEQRAEKDSSGKRPDIEIWDTDVFGAENVKVKIDDFEDKRKKLYDTLQKSLPDYLDHFFFKQKGSVYGRREVLKDIKDAFHVKAFSDTTRPNNDTSLWEHCYAVASLFKTGIVHEIIYKKRLDDFNKVRFGILGIGWDGLAFVSSGHKIRDIVGRKKVIQDFNDAIRRLVEYEYLLGNCVYEDDNGIYFIVPSTNREENKPDNCVEFSFDNTLSANSEYRNLLVQLQNDIQAAALKVTGGDIYPHFHIVNETSQMTCITECIQEVKKKTAFPCVSGAGFEKKITNDWAAGIKEAKVCPVCGRRPLYGKDSETCKPCEDRRVAASSITEENAEDPNAPKETVFITEIIRASGTSKKAALLVAKFDIRRWLCGEMVRTLFVKEANTLEREVKNLGEIVDFKDKEQAARDWLTKNKTNPYNYQRIKDEVLLCRDYDKNVKDSKGDLIEYARNIVFLYGRRTEKDFNKLSENWNVFLESAKKEHKREIETSKIKDEDLLCNILCAKTPTPSTVLDVWGATHGFTKGLKKDFHDLLGEQKRIVCKISELNDEIAKQIKNGLAYEGKIENEEVEVVWKDKDKKEAWIIGKYKIEDALKNWKEGGTITIKGKPFGKTEDVRIGRITNITDMAYLPFRTITAAPDLFMAIVPADSVMEITQKIHDEYTKQFGKVIGRLPFSIGHVFFKEKTPMFAVLDGGRRMVRNFDVMSGKKEFTVRETVKCLGNNNAVCVSQNSTKPKKTDIWWSLPHALGTGDEDWHHPYLMVKGSDESLSSRKTFFKTIAGNMIHFSEIAEGDTISAYPNYYDFEFLDSISRRHYIHIGAEGNGRGSGTFALMTRPYLLEDIDWGMKRLWDFLMRRKDMTDTKLRNIESILCSKLEEWKVDLQKTDDTATKEFACFLERLIEREFAGISEEDSAFFKTAVLSGLFFDCMELYLRILKLRITE